MSNRKSNIYETVENTLRENERYVAENGTLLKANIYSDIMTMNKILIQILLKNEEIRNRFFIKIDQNYIFDKQAFAWFIEEKEFLPDSYTEYSNKIGLTTNNNYLCQNNDVAIDFPYKDCVLEGGQVKEEEKRNEIFFNEVIAEMISASSDDIRMLVFNNCFSSTQAEMMVDKVEAAIGMNTSIGDESAILFSSQLYSTIGFGLPLEKAFAQAKARLMLENTKEENTPEIFIKDGFKAEDIVFIK